MKVSRAVAVTDCIFLQSAECKFYESSLNDNHKDKIKQYYYNCIDYSDTVTKTPLGHFTTTQQSVILS